MKRKKKRTKRLVIGGICAVVVIALAAGGVYLKNKNNAAAASQTSKLTYQVNEVTKDEITVDVSGSGTLTPVQGETFTSACAGTVQTVNKSVGDAVEAGEVIATVYSEELEQQIEKTEDELDSVNTQIANTSKTASSKYIKAGISGQVKNIKAKAGSIVEDVQGKSGYLCVISTDGQMQVTFTAKEDVNKYDDVTVTIGSSAQAGTVTAVSGKKATVVIDDNSCKVGASATVKNEDGTTLGTGKMKLCDYVEVTAQGGVIDSVLKDENDTVYASTNLFKLTDYPVSGTYESLRNQKEELEEQLDELKKNENISVDYAGTVTDLPIAAGDSVEKDDELCVVQGREGYELTVNVDELDISDIDKGAAATVTVDALDGSYEGEVTYISNVGNTESSVTTYEVVIRTDEIEGALSGMNASATITAESSGETLTVPVDAVQEEGGESFVWLAPDGSVKGDEFDGEETDTGEFEKVTVTTGMSDGSFIAVEGSLSEGSLIIVPVLETTSDGSESETDERQFMKGGMMGEEGQMGGGRMGEGEMPSGMPSGGRAGGDSSGGAFGQGGVPSGGISSEGGN